MKSVLFAIFTTAMLFQGCAQHQSSDFDEQLAEADNTYIYDIKLQNIIEPLDQKNKLFEGFPFISSSVSNDFKGHFSPEFYAKNRPDLRSSSLDKVDIWSLQLAPKLLDVIYIKAIWIEDYKDVSDDLFVNLCYTYNLSDGQQEILKEWIKQGGMFWVENGVYSTGSEIGPERRLSQKQRFLGREVKSVHYSLSDTVNKESIVFDRLDTTASFDNIRSLQLDLKRASQTFFIIEGEDHIKNSAGQTMLSIAKYGKGNIVSMLPVESYDAYRDGEILRWQLLKTLKEMRKADTTIIADKNIEEKKPEKEVIVQKATTLTKGRSIQLFSYRNKAGAYKALKEASKHELARVEKIGDFYVGRVGMYNSDKDASKDLKQLRLAYPGAYMRTCVYDVPVNEQTTASKDERPSKYTLLTMDDTIEHKAATSPVQENSTSTKSVLKNGRCIQLFTYRNRAGAYKDIQKAQAFKHARVEKSKNYYFGRVGMYASDKEAREDLERLQQTYPGAYMRTCVLNVPSTVQVESKRSPVTSKQMLDSIDDAISNKESITPKISTPIIVKEKLPRLTQEQNVPKAMTLTKGRCIQLFSYRNKAGAYKDIEKVRAFTQARVEKPGSYYVGRVGMYASDREAREDLKRIQEDFPGAYMRTCVLRVPDENPSYDEDTSKTMGDTIDTPKETVTPENTTTPEATVLTKGRCIQLFSYSNKAGAYKEIEKADGFADARVEKSGKYYSGRVGMYGSDKDAFEDLKRLQMDYPGAYMRTCIFHQVKN